ncbi:MAG: WbqC family protein [Saprospiraceae bacterium]|nr:WbqC family protein [Candidatus Defluviibacterium haderslevense]
MGYFAKLVYADKLVVLDNVYFSKRKHIDRVQIVNMQGEIIWIGLPVGNKFKTPCNKIYFNDKETIEKIIKTLYSSYSKARYFKENISYIEKILIESIDKSDILSEIDIFITTKLIELLKIKSPEINRSSQFVESTFLEPTERLIYLCEKLKTNNIIVGSIEATEKHDVKKLNKFGINILLQDYLNNHPTYYQTRRTQLGFAKGLSIVDCIFNIGIEETKILLNLTPLKYGKG